MSAQTSFHVVRRDGIPRLVAAAALPDRDVSFRQALAGVGLEIENDPFPWSGYAFVFLMEFLGGRDVYVGSAFQDAEEALSKGRIGAYLITPETFAGLGSLDPDLYDEADICQFFDELGMGFEEAGMAGHDGISALAEHVPSLGSDRALLVLIG